MFEIILIFYLDQIDQFVWKLYIFRCTGNDESQMYLNALFRIWS